MGETPSLAGATAGWLDRGRLLRTALLGIAGLVAVAIEAAPVGLGAGALPSPDLLLCVVALWALRAAAETPALLVFALGLVRDLVTDLPVGLGALALVAAAEALKTQRVAIARQPAVVTVLAVALAASLMALGLWLALVVSFVEPPALVDLAMQVGTTAIAFPVVALLLGAAVGRRTGSRSGRRARDAAGLPAGS